MGTTQILTLSIALVLSGHCLWAAEHAVASSEEVEALIQSGGLSPGDAIVWTVGEYFDEELDIQGTHGQESHPITLRAAKPGGVILRGESRFHLGAHWWVIEGFHFDGSDGATNSYNPVQFRSRSGVAAQNTKMTNCAVTDVNAEGSSSKWVLLFGRHNTVERCYFKGKKCKGALLTVELGYLDDDESAEHRIVSNHFAEFTRQDGTDNETIRVGASQDQDKPANCLIERNYFFQCDGENEIVSNKSSFNTYRFNTFRRCNGALVLRHGHHARVEGNYFLGDGATNAGGIRIVDSHHVVINNHMQSLSGTTWNAALSILGGNQASGNTNNGYQAVDDIVVAHNSIIHCMQSIFLNDAKGSRAPTGLMANNLIVSASTPLIHPGLSPDGLTWTGNLFQESRSPSSKPGAQLEESGSLWRPGLGGAAIDAAERIAFSVESDIDGWARPSAGRDIGAHEVNSKRREAVRAPLQPSEVGVTFLRPDNSLAQ